MIAPQPQCTACTHLDRQAEADPHCDAFPGGIPDEIWTNEVAHTSSYPGDRGIHLELIPLDVLGQTTGEA
ncbi:hypothetical protein [Rubrivirga marina]|uniref:Uncharacterized protein n=1 Tax=Rubrivirga marina TaxID=1196024 RepID=A0A271IWX9_9BACT|nr:hypothetical protein [Rubrivirga marina]PAP75692.1 hypothetical protein BSZ37_04195 [Rubrivirga marina]